jgi:hypothetical protein
MKYIKYPASIIILILLPVAMSTFAQKKGQTGSLTQTRQVNVIVFKAENWEFKPQTVEFLEYKSRPALKLLTSGDIAVVKNINFTNGTIECDLQPLDPSFTSIYFRWKDSKENECFYFRTERAGKPQAIDAIQYAPTIDGVNLWNMLPHFQTNADFKKEDWNHLKLVISGKQMRVYVNNMMHPALEVPMLEGNVDSGTLAFEGEAIISNLIIKNNEVEGLSAEAGTDLTYYDPRYLRKWKVSEPVTTVKGIDFSDEYIPKAETKWEDISAERQGLINLTRKFGSTKGRRITWLKTTIYSDKTQDKMLHLGFNNEVWMTINDKPLYVDKNIYNTPIAKQPDGRCSLENSLIKIPLREGKNQLMIGVANFFYGWGIVARMDDLDGIILEK